MDVTATFFVVLAGALILAVGSILFYMYWTRILVSGRGTGKEGEEPTTTNSLPRQGELEEATINRQGSFKVWQEGSTSHRIHPTHIAFDVEVPETVPASSSGRETLQKLESTRLREFGYEELARVTGSFSNLNLLGEGGFGQVYKGTFPNGEVYAIKKLKYDEAGSREAEFAAEMMTITRIHHRNLVKLIGYCIDEPNRLLVYEFVKHNSLRSHLHGGKDALSWPDRLKIAIGSAVGLQYLHQYCNPKIIHRDIKADNILLDEKFEPKITDFGLAKDFSYSHTHISTDTKGTFGYLAPEYNKDRKLTEKSDVFSFGVVLLELLTGKKHAFKNNGGELIALAEWVVPRIKRTMETGIYEAFLDPKLVRDGYNVIEVTRMIYCAAACVFKPAKCRPDMKMVVEVLDGKMGEEHMWLNTDVEYLCSEAPYGSLPAGNHNVTQPFDEALHKRGSTI